MLCALIMSCLCKRFDSGSRPYTALELRKDTNIPIRIVNDLLYKLMEARLVVEISSDEKGEQARYMPAENIERLSVGLMIDRLESQGKWKIDLALSEHYTHLWGKAMEFRRNYLKESRAILLKDL